MRFWIIALLLACCTGWVAAQNDKPLIPDYISGEFTYGGFSRTYALVTPRSTDKDAKYPLVVVFHGAGGSGIEMMAQTHLKELAQEKGYMIAFPNGIEQGWGYLDKDELHTRDLYTDDWNFFAALVDDIGTHASVDTSRIYVMGFSNGGSLGYRIMCEYPDRLAGVVIVASTLSSYTANHCVGTAPVPLMMVLGSSDRVFPFGGSAEIKEDGSIVLQFSFQQQMLFLAQHQKCSLAGGTTRTVSTPDSSIRVIRDFYNECDGGEPILLYVLMEYDHGYGASAPIMTENGETGTIENAIFDFFDTYPGSSQ